jgi:hypothetical protein
LRECLALIKQGVPWKVVFGEELSGPLSNDERLAYLIMFGEMDGGTFNWSTGKWEKPK